MRVQGTPEKDVAIHRFDMRAEKLVCRRMSRQPQTLIVVGKSFDVMIEIGRAHV